MFRRSPQLVICGVSSFERALLQPGEAQFQDEKGVSKCKGDDPQNAAIKREIGSLHAGQDE